MKWLVTAFEPFAGATTNSSLIVAEALRKREWSGQVDFFTPVPCRFADAWSAVRGQLKPEHRAVLGLGQAESRSRVGLERVALNWIDARIADNSGVTRDQARVQDGADMLWSPIPWERLEDSSLWERSYSAGTFVCNALMYQAVDWARQNGRLAGFVHIPLLESQTEPRFKGMPRMADQVAIDSAARILRFLTELE
jgi:pyroglutamyl-peptidase